MGPSPGRLLLLIALTSKAVTAASTDLDLDLRWNPNSLRGPSPEKPLGLGTFWQFQRRSDGEAEDEESFEGYSEELTDPAHPHYNYPPPHPLPPVPKMVVRGREGPFPGPLPSPRHRPRSRSRPRDRIFVNKSKFRLPNYRALFGMKEKGRSRPGPRRPPHESYAPTFVSYGPIYGPLPIQSMDQAQAKPQAAPYAPQAQPNRPHYGGGGFPPPTQATPTYASQQIHTTTTRTFTHPPPTYGPPVRIPNLVTQAQSLQWAPTSFPPQNMGHGPWHPIPQNQNGGGWNAEPPRQNGGWNTQPPPKQKGGWDAPPPRQKGGGGWDTPPKQNSGGWETVQSTNQNGGGWETVQPTKQNGGWETVQSTKQNGGWDTPPKQNGGGWKTVQSTKQNGGWKTYPPPSPTPAYQNYGAPPTGSYATPSSNYIPPTGQPLGHYEPTASGPNYEPALRSQELELPMNFGPPMHNFGPPGSSYGQPPPIIGDPPPDRYAPKDDMYRYPSGDGAPRPGSKYENYGAKTLSDLYQTPSKPFRESKSKRAYAEGPQAQGQGHDPNGRPPPHYDTNYNSPGLSKDPKVTDWMPHSAQHYHQLPSRKPKKGKAPKFRTLPAKLRDHRHDPEHDKYPRLTYDTLSKRSGLLPTPARRRRKKNPIEVRTEREFREMLRAHAHLAAIQ